MSPVHVITGRTHYSDGHDKNRDVKNVLIAFDPFQKLQLETENISGVFGTSTEIRENI